MRIYKFGHVLLTLLIATASASLLLADASLGEMQMLAQAVDRKKQEADRLFNQGKKQFSASQFEAALQSWHSSLSIYREIKDSQGEYYASGIIGMTY
ncbi:hypothetical protein DSM106972_038180 [Dulcicalothrix desertica PCC 7102]|uniref:Uncharacterized protein n=1 Tax=Dulcicalothrix desertica PCC 7102 TaxID=232991 RepID=A0A433VFX7_9CYAN|nr:hypothetical protein [Dulcicalothrix desertica]RUT04997.1 hypothetical protein DSM106972_038180 [Dulcicalothrix desertica PCC 7102]